MTTDFRSVWLLVFWGRLTRGEMILIPMKEKIYCNTCRMDSFLFDYCHYIVLNDSKTNRLYKLLFEKSKETKNGKNCTFCNGLATQITIERTYLNLPEWLIVIVEQSQINSLEINSFFILLYFTGYSLFV